MRLMRRCLDNEGGWILPTMLILAGVMVIAVLSVLEIGATDGSLAKRDNDASQALFLAESGIQRGEAWLRAQTSAPSDTMYPFGEAVQHMAGGTYTGKIWPDTTGVRTTFTVASKGVAGSRWRSLQVDVQPRAFTDYLYYVNRNVGGGWPHWFYTGEIIDGPMHCNGEFGIMGDPTFVGHVSSGASTFFYYNNGSAFSSSAPHNAPHDEPVFQDGYTLGAPPMDWVSQSDLNTVAGINDITLNGNHEVVFGRDDGSGPMIGYVSYRKNKNWTDVLISSMTNGVIYCNGGVELSGVLDGRITIVSGGQIDIVDDVVYYDSDANGPTETCDDMLGLIAGTKINVANNAANRNDCEIHCYAIAVNNQGCLVEDYSSGSPRGTLTLYGGIGQDKWGPVGTGYWNGSEVIVMTGYERDFHYDWRFRDALPPGFDLIVFESDGFVRVAWRDVTTY